MADNEMKPKELELTNKEFNKSGEQVKNPKLKSM